MKSPKAYQILLIICVFCCSCKRHASKEYTTVNRGFYFWKEKFDLSHSEIERLDTLKVKKFYVKVFEVVPDPKNFAVPKAVIKFYKPWPWPKGMEFIPVVFIKNQTFHSLHDKDLEWLATKVYKKIKKVFISTGFKEMQIDCDWTESTKEKYFTFLKNLKKVSKEEISATIRLHQIKDQKIMGVPPVDKGMVMYYNMGEITSYNEPNSIMNNFIGKSYLPHKVNYELPLDFALPVFSWGILFRYGEFQGILNDFDPKYLDHSIFKKKGNTNWYRIERDTVLNETYFRYNDEIRFEKTNPKNLFKACKILKRIQTPNSETNLVFFSWNKAKKFEDEIIDSIYSSF